ncbi:MAG: CBS domain-containing protein [Myxococcota bacterium]|jgi:CBS domain-containing protein/sporulation protein YlmC with PRC-barrel domain
MTGIGQTTFLFFSQLLGKKVTDSSGEVVGKLHDLLARVPDIYPRVEWLVIARGSVPSTLLTVKWSDVEIGKDLSIVLRVRLSELKAWVDEATDGVVRFRGDLLDKQIVDTAGRKVVRVNDLHLLWADPELRIAHIDVGVRGIVRRLGLEKPVDASVRTLLGGKNAYLKREVFVSWKYVEMFARSSEPGKVKLAVSESKLKDIHPAELAEIMEDLDSFQREALFRSLDSETAAEALSEVDDPKIQETLLSSVGDEKAADILEEMAPDEAADLLAELPEATARGLIGKMEAEDASTVKELLQHEEDTAGGLMTTEFIDLHLGQLVGEIFEVLRKEANEAELIYYLYVVNSGGQLSGVLTLKDLILADPGKTVDEIMEPNPESVNVDDGLGKIAEITTKYKLMALPVVDDRNRLKGVITIDDVFDMVVETGWKKKLTKG